jgi:hypothetical protein
MKHAWYCNVGMYFHEWVCCARALTHWNYYAIISVSMHYGTMLVYLLFVWMACRLHIVDEDIRIVSVDRLYVLSSSIVVVH